MVEETVHENEEDYQPAELNRNSITNDDVERQISAFENVISEYEIQKTEFQVSVDIIFALLKMGVVAL